MKTGEKVIFSIILAVVAILWIVATEKSKDPCYTKADYYTVDQLIEDGFVDIEENMVERYDLDGDGILTHDDALEIRDILKRKGKW